MMDSEKSKFKQTITSDQKAINPLVISIHPSHNTKFLIFIAQDFTVQRFYKKNLKKAPQCARNDDFENVPHNEKSPVSH
jgi:hypothetical protein